MGELILMLLGCIYSPAPFYVQFANIFLLKNNFKNIFLFLIFSYFLNHLFYQKPIEEKKAWELYKNYITHREGGRGFNISN